jgi:hypothetical protein
MMRSYLPGVLTAAPYKPPTLSGFCRCFDLQVNRDVPQVKTADGVSQLANFFKVQTIGARLAWGQTTEAGRRREGQNVSHARRANQQKPVQPPCEKYSAFPKSQIIL